MPGQQMQFWQNNSAVDCCWMHQDCGFGFQLPFWCPSNGDEMTERAVLNYFSKQFSATAGLGQLWEFANSIMNFVFMTRSKLRPASNKFFKVLSVYVQSPDKHQHASKHESKNLVDILCKLLLKWCKLDGVIQWQLHGEVSWNEIPTLVVTVESNHDLNRDVNSMQFSNHVANL